MILKVAFLIFVGLAFLGGGIADSLGRQPGPVTATISRGSDKNGWDQTSDSFVVSADDYQTDIDRLIALRSHPLDELLTLAAQMEVKWRRIDWNSYAVIMRYACSEISNRGITHERVRDQTQYFARIALSHSSMYSWKNEMMLVGFLGYERWSANDDVWLRERRSKADLWLHAWRRLEKHIDPTFDMNDRKSRPSMRVYPPEETNLPPGSPPSAIKDLHLRAKYQAAIAANNTKSQRLKEQFPLLLHGPSFRTRAERWLIQAYSQPPVRNTELQIYLAKYALDAKTRQRILSEVVKNSQ
jgi:hypothetical protein